ncbi:MAG: UDP-N-acetylmuramoyl-L-alanyl-D-glutamate--2,6-diaminopimelate ligase [Clostridia bacterium]|nr:UDP-N-acetylmuramoyl-L-alanyl-D-glutamate--2,6-diaminopimelate ligase [Clostridia bacterium]
MILSDLLNGLDYNINNKIYDDIKIENICNSLNDVTKNSVFIAIKGLHFDGHSLIYKAIIKGASVIVTEYPIDEIKTVNVVVSDTRLAYAIICANYFDNPAKKLILTGVTGTNGKTTTVYMLEHILSEAGYKTGIIGTIETVLDKKSEKSSYTTPEPRLMHSLLSRMANVGCTHTVMEVSSHSLEQKRVYGLNFKLGIFTNLSIDHLDYHGTMENYKNAKIKLFKQSEICLANMDSDFNEDFINYPGAFTYSVLKEADFKAVDIIGIVGNTSEIQGVKYTCITKNGKYNITTQIPGMFSVYNSLAAFSAACLLGIDPNMAAISLSTFKGVKGRMEYIKTNKPFNVLIDFAHTPDGLSNLLQTIRPLTPGRIILVFGCGGDRDKSKRPIMGKIAELHSDFTVITSDNPRSENPSDIINDIVKGLTKNENYITITDRTEAIKYALEIAKEGDTVVLAGKGHEEYQIFKDKTISYNERDIIKSILNLE